MACVPWCAGWGALSAACPVPAARPVRTLPVMWVPLAHAAPPAATQSCCLPHLAPQLAALTSLRSLELRGSGFPLASAQCGAVGQLTALTRLCLRHFSNLPRPLVAALPALRRSLLSLQLISLRGEGKPAAHGCAVAALPLHPPAHPHSAHPRCSRDTAPLFMPGPHPQATCTGRGTSSPRRGARHPTWGQRWAS